jgi:hypothetical protein
VGDTNAAIRFCQTAHDFRRISANCNREGWMMKYWRVCGYSLGV